MDWWRNESVQAIMWRVTKWGRNRMKIHPCTVRPSCRVTSKGRNKMLSRWSIEQPIVCGRERCWVTESAHALTETRQWSETEHWREGEKEKCVRRDKKKKVMRENNSKSLWWQSGYGRKKCVVGKTCWAIDPFLLKDEGGESFYLLITSKTALKESCPRQESLLFIISFHFVIILFVINCPLFQNFLLSTQKPFKVLKNWVHMNSLS